MDPYEQYLLDAEYEDYLKQAQAEDIANSVNRGVQPPFARNAPSQLGPDYSRSVGGNFVEGITEAPGAGLQFVEDAYNFAMPLDALSTSDLPSGPVDTIKRAGAEQTLRTVGGLAGGTAGAAALAPIGAGWGSVLGPWGAAGGALLGGAIGFGGGLMGFDMVTDAATGELRPTDEYVKDLAYNTSQGVVLGAPFEAARALKPGVKKLTQPFTQEGAEARVANKLQALEPNLASQIDTALVQGADNPFLDYTPLGELIDSDVLKSAQRTVARSGLENYGKSAEANRIRNDAQLKYLDQIDTSTLTPEDVQSSIRQGIKNKLAASQRGLTSAESVVTSALDDLAPPIDKIEAGATIREGAIAGKDAIKGRVTEKFENVGTGIVDPAPAQIVAAELMPKYFKEVGAQPNPELVKLVESLSREAEVSGLLDASGQPLQTPATYTMQDIQALRSQALKIANSSDLRTAKVAGQIAESLKVAGDDAVKAGTVTPEQAKSWTEGIELRKEQGTIYESSATPTKQVLSKQPYGDFKVPESAIPSKYFRPGERGTREAIQNYKRAIGASEQALEPLYRYATDSFRDYVIKDGKVDGKKARKWLDRHASALEEMPELKKQLSNVDEAQRFLNEKYGDLQRTQAEVETGALKQFLQVDPEKAIGAMLSGKDMVKRTISTVQYLKANDADALAGLRRGVIDHLKQKAFIPDGKVSLEEAVLKDGPRFDGTVRGGLLKAEWEKIKPALERSKLFTESQMKGFDYLYKDKSSQLSVEKAKMPGGSDTIQNASTLAALSRAASSGFLRNLPFGRYVAFLEPVLKAIPEGKFQAALEEALLNPRYARDLLSKATAKNFTRSAELIFKDELAKAFGDTTPGAALATGAKVAAPFAGVATQDRSKDLTTGGPRPVPQSKLFIPKQQAITSKKSFPTPQELLKPPSSGSLKKSSFNLQGYIGSQAPETQARIAVESSGNPYAVSPKGAQGLSQLMPATAQEIADELGETYMPLTSNMTPEQQQASIEQNVRFGDYYYNKQLKRFKKPTLAWAAYNAGPGRVTEAIAMAGSETDVNKILSNLPKGVQKETVPYVNNIMARLTQRG